MKSTSALRASLTLPLITFIVIGAARAGFAAPADPTPASPVQGYKLAWSDEFNGTALDTSKWDYRTDTKGFSVQQPANISVANGLLTIALKHEDAGALHHTGGGVISKGAFKYGYFESRFKIPAAHGWHTSFWLMTHDGKGDTSPAVSNEEVDICENNSFNPFNYAPNLHRWLPTHIMIGPVQVKTPDLSADFHIWGCEVTPTVVNMFFDGKQVASFPDDKIDITPENIWLTSIAYPDWSGHTGPDDTKLPDVAEFDYVRYFAKQ